MPNNPNEARNAFVETVDNLLAVVNPFDGWHRLEETDTRRRFNTIGLLAGRLGYQRPPVEFREEHERGFGGDTLTHVTINHPYQKAVCRGYLPQDCCAPRQLYYDRGMEQLPPCYVLCETLEVWRIEVLAMKFPGAVLTKQPNPTEPKTPAKRNIDDARAYELVRNERKTLKAAGRILADEAGRPKPFAPQSVRRAVGRYLKVREDAGLGDTARSIPLGLCNQFRDDDAFSL